MPDENFKQDDIQRKGYEAEIKEISRDKKTVTSYVSTMDKDAYQEVVLPDFRLERYQKNPVVLWGHNMWQDLPPVGRSLWQKPDEKGLLAKTEFAVKNQFAKDVWNLYADGFLKAFSIGYIPHKRVHPGDDEWADLFAEWGFDASAREIQLDNELFEYSTVPVPANPNAVVTALKSGMLKSQQMITCLNQAVETDLQKKENQLAGDEEDEDVNKLILEELRKLNEAIAQLGKSDDKADLYEEALKIHDATRRDNNPQKREPAPDNGTGPEATASYEDLRRRIPDVARGVVREMKGRVS